MNGRRMRSVIRARNVTTDALKAQYMSRFSVPFDATGDEARSKHDARSLSKEGDDSVWGNYMFFDVGRKQPTKIGKKTFDNYLLFSKSFASKNGELSKAG